MLTYFSHMISTLVREDGGQDLVEYSLLLAFIVLAGAAAFIGMTEATNGMWNTINTRLSNANQ